MNLFEQQASNRRRTWAVMAVFVAFLFFLGYGFDRFYLGGGAMPFPIGSLVALGVGGLSAWSSYYAGDRAVLLSSGAIALEDAAPAGSDEDKLKYRQLENVVDEMSIAAGLPRPEDLRRPRSRSECVCDRARSRARVDCGDQRACSIRSIATSCRAWSRTS